MQFKIDFEFSWTSISLIISENYLFVQFFWFSYRVIQVVYFFLKLLFADKNTTFYLEFEQQNEFHKEKSMSHSISSTCGRNILLDFTLKVVSFSAYTLRNIFSNFLKPRLTTAVCCWNLIEILDFMMTFEFTAP